MLITAERILTGTDVLCPGWLEITDGTISALGQGTPPRPIDPTAGDLELGPQIVVPGFVDMHTHGGGSGAFPDATEQSSRTAVALHRRHGTTTLIASLVSAHPEELLREVSVLGEQVQEGLIAGIHLEGPWLSSRRCGAHEPSALRRPDPAEISRVFAAAKGGIRMVTIAPELDGALPAIHQIVELGRSQPSVTPMPPTTKPGRPSPPGRRWPRTCSMRCVPSINANPAPWWRWVKILGLPSR